MKKVILTLIVVLLTQISFSQIKKFGKVSVEELTETQNETFKDANAVVLFKDRKTNYEYDGETGWKLVTSIHERIKIYNKEAFNKATKKINFYTGISSRNEETVTIKAITYNLVGNKIEKTKLKKKDIFTTKENKFWSTKKFTMPNVKDNCIVEWEYKITSPHTRDIIDVVFQYDLPIIYFESKIKIPKYFLFNTDISKYYIINVKQSKSNRKLNYSYRSQDDKRQLKTTRHNETVDVIENVFTIKEKNIEAIKEEPYINNIENYVGKVKFENIGTNFPGSGYKSYSTNWNTVTKSIYESPNFGKELKKTSYFKDDIQSIISESTSREEKINILLEFVKKKVKWNGYYGIFTHDGVKKAYKNGVGNVAEVNLILVAMLREAGIDASPILVSTRSHGIPIFPTRKGFNYVIAGIELPEKILLLDATEKYSGVNNLPRKILNWKGRIVRKTGSSAFIDLFPKVYSLETNRASIKVKNDGSIDGNLRLGFKNLKALEFRNALSSLSKEQLITQLEEMLSPIEIEKVRLGNKDDVSKPFVVSLPFKADNQAEIIQDKIYFTPLFFLKTEENKFKSEDRKLPVDFASAWLTSDEVQIQIPDGYKVETLPESISIATENGIGNYEFTISTKENKIFLKSITKVNIPIIPLNMYKELKDFYSKRLLKMKEKVVLVKN